MPTLCKQERLFEKRLLSMLFGKGKRLVCGSSENQIRVCFLSLPKTEVWQEAQPDFNIRCKLLVNAPKSRYKHAVDRNRIKRLLREAYRFHKPLFEALPTEENVLLLSLQFTGKNVFLQPRAEAELVRIMPRREKGRMKSNLSLDMMRTLTEEVAHTLQNRLKRA